MSIFDPGGIGKITGTKDALDHLTEKRKRRSDRRDDERNQDEPKAKG